jgi:hypothetical protein
MNHDDDGGNAEGGVERPGGFIERRQRIVDGVSMISRSTGSLWHNRLKPEIDADEERRGRESSYPWGFWPYGTVAGPLPTPSRSGILYMDSQA